MSSQDKIHVLKKLKEMKIFQALEKYEPVFAGTIPIDIHTPESDVDIICYAQNLEAFYNDLKDHFQTYNNFKIYQREVKSKQSVVCSFNTKWFLIEIFGQNTPSKLQDAYRHMLIEERIINLSPDPQRFREQIRDMKLSGIKTEPAFAQYFNLKGCPYASLLELEKLSDSDIRQTLKW